MREDDIKYVDLNSDIGEGFGSYVAGLDDEIIRHVSSVNIACGWHAGDPLIMEKTLRNALSAGVAVGAHPGYPDLLGFGRRQMAISPEEARAYTLYQLGALEALLRGIGSTSATLNHIKLHGAFYNTAANHEKIADAVIDGIAAYNGDLILVTLSGSYMAKAARTRGVRVAEEVFADRGYYADGTLVPRNLPGALIQDEETAMRRVVSMVKEGKVCAVDGKEFEIRADTVCVHGDHPGATDFVRRIRHHLEHSGIRVTALQNFIE